MSLLGLFGSLVMDYYYDMCLVFDLSKIREGLGFREELYFGISTSAAPCASFYSHAGLFV